MVIEVPALITTLLHHVQRGSEQVETLFDLLADAVELHAALPRDILQRDGGAAQQQHLDGAPLGSRQLLQHLRGDLTGVSRVGLGVLVSEQLQHAGLLDRLGFAYSHGTGAVSAPLEQLERLAADGGEHPFVGLALRGEIVRQLKGAVDGLAHDVVGVGTVADKSARV